MNPHSMNPHTAFPSFFQVCSTGVIIWHLCLVSFQCAKGQRYRFSLLVQEMKGSETEEYVACVLAFMNCIIAGAPDISSRIRLRNEVIGERTMPRGWQYCDTNINIVIPILILILLN